MTSNYLNAPKLYTLFVRATSTSYGAVIVNRDGRRSNLKGASNKTTQERMVLTGIIEGVRAIFDTVKHVDSIPMIHIVLESPSLALNRIQDKDEPPVAPYLNDLVRALESLIKCIPVTHLTQAVCFNNCVDFEQALSNARAASALLISNHQPKPKQLVRLPYDPDPQAALSAEELIELHEARAKHPKVSYKFKRWSNSRW
jgi:hypothetical protein